MVDELECFSVVSSADKLDGTAVASMVLLKADSTESLLAGYLGKMMVATMVDLMEFYLAVASAVLMAFERAVEMALMMVAL